MLRLQPALHYKNRTPTTLSISIPAYVYVDYLKQLQAVVHTVQNRNHSWSRRKIFRGGKHEIQKRWIQLNAGFKVFRSGRLSHTIWYSFRNVAFLQIPAGAIWLLLTWWKKGLHTEGKEKFFLCKLLKIATIFLPKM